MKGKAIAGAQLLNVTWSERGPNSCLLYTSTPVTLVNSAQGYLNLLNQESQKFATAEQNQRNKVIEERKNELSNLGSQIEKKKEMILQMQAEVEQMSKSLELKKNEAAGFAEKLNATKQEFEVAMKSIAGQIAEDIQKMNQYLK